MLSATEAVASNHTLYLIREMMFEIEKTDRSATLRTVDGSDAELEADLPGDRQGSEQVGRTTGHVAAAPEAHELAGLEKSIGQAGGRTKLGSFDAPSPIAKLANEARARASDLGKLAAPTTLDYPDFNNAF